MNAHMPVVDVPRCSYCFMAKGQRHMSFCDRPGLSAEIAAEKKRVLYAATRCRECGTILVKGQCPVDWCPSGAVDRKATAAGESLGIGCAWIIAIFKWAVVFTLLWVAWRAWNGEL